MEGLLIKYLGQPTNMICWGWWAADNQNYQFISIFSHYNNYGAPLPVKNKGRPNANLPIFWEFVQFVIHQKKSSMDEHWKPTANYCSMCIINYDYVIKFEDLSQESQEFLKVTNLKQFISDDIWDRHLNPNRPKEMSR